MQMRCDDVRDEGRPLPPRPFDAIVIGSGLGGLTAGALFARAGRKVLVLERNRSFGGAATVYRHGSLAIEASLHEIDGLDAADPKGPVLRALGLDRDLQFVDVGTLHEVRSPLFARPFVMPHGLGAAIVATKAHFPRQSRGIERYFRRLQSVRDAVSMMSAHQDDRSWWLRNALMLPWHLWPLIRERRATLSDVFTRLFGDDETIKLALASNLAYYTDDPDTMPFIHFAVAQASYLAGGGHYVRGGSQALSDALVAIIRETGGAAEAGREVETIVLDGASARGVRHRATGGGDLRTELAPVLFGNAAPSVLAAMLPEQKQTRFMSRYRDRRLSISLWSIAIGLNRHSGEFGVRHYSTSILPSWLGSLAGLRESAALLGETSSTRLPPYGFVAYDQIASGLNTEGPYLCAVVGLDRIENWIGLGSNDKRARKERWMDFIIGDLDQQFPGLAGAIVHREMSTSETFQHYLNTPGGSLYGFAPQSRGFMPLVDTAIKGLYLASAFTGGGGFTGAILGGGWAARAAMRAGAVSSFQSTSRGPAS
jgi:phytoene dehydrogenase-like protein